MAAGVRNWAVVRAVCRATDPLAAIRRLQKTENARRNLLRTEGEMG